MIPVQRFGRLLFLSVVTAAASWSGQSATAAPGSIQWYVDKAKEQGKTSITIQAPQGMHEWITSLDQALTTYHVVIGTPIEAATQLVDSDHVYTWYKLSITELLIAHPNPDVPAVSTPESLLPVKANEIVIRVPEGTVTVDGVKVTVTDPEVRLLTLNTKYLFFLSPDTSGKFAYLRSGANSIFVVNHDDKVAPLVATQSRMQEDLDFLTGGSMHLIRGMAKSKASLR